ncbi:MAG: glycerophosphodiester phosphodiesterase [Anaeromyxobacter sp.]|nr:glycerophosphodiester phosphodiesterase [Anaeromyxobacter sp.]MBL0277391.1 glycerophosphodiester phosphodiesterase [Anaeromyxobacter sp.]
MDLPFVPAPRAAGRPLVLGHRGASAEAPENTLAAFRLAAAQGADGVELDVWRCGSGEIVVIHDESTLRTCGQALLVPEAPLAALRALDAGAWKGAGFRGERIPLLAEVLEALPDAVINVELKARRGGGDPGLAAGVAAAVAAARAEARVLVSSFDFSLVAALRAAAPRLATGLLFEDAWHWRWRVPVGVARLRPSALHPDRRLCTPARLGRWVRSGRAVAVWTVDQPDEQARLARAGVAALITNAPGAARRALGRAGGAGA